ncbi:MAG: hypothetical protein JNJ43_13755 [Anaerolineales bacterium]|nr:hypothetical protein [Anaerolineales bacterium]
MNKDFFLQLINSQKYLPLRFGFVIAAIHFLISLFIFFVVRTSYGNFFYYIYLLLNAPSYLLLLIGNFNFFHSEAFMIIFSSTIYGVSAGLLTAEDHFTQAIGRLIVGLLIIFFFLIIMWFGIIFG